MSIRESKEIFSNGTDSGHDRRASKGSKFFRDSKSYIKILQGTYQPPPNMDIYTATFLQSLYKLIHLINELLANLPTSTYINR